MGVWRATADAEIVQSGRCKNLPGSLLRRYAENLFWQKICAAGTIKSGRMSRASYAYYKHPPQLFDSTYHHKTLLP
jgi:hypothetical protein